MGRVNQILDSGIGNIDEVDTESARSHCCGCIPTAVPSNSKQCPLSSSLAEGTDVEISVEEMGNARPLSHSEEDEHDKAFDNLHMAFSQNTTRRSTVTMASPVGSDGPWGS